MWYAVAYDIVDDGRRNKIASILAAYGERVQYSVFECNLGSDELEKLMCELKGRLEPEGDSIRIYATCEGCREKMRVIGRGSKMGQEEERRKRVGWVV